MHAAHSRLSATWFDGISPQPQAVDLAWHAGELLLHHCSTGATRRYAARTVTWPERTRHGTRQVLLPDGGVVTLADAAAWDAWAAGLGLAQPLAARMALSWRGALVALGLVLLTMGVAWQWGIPYAARQIVPLVPAAWEARLGQSLLGQLTAQKFIKPSELSAARRERIDHAVRGLLRAVPADWDLMPVTVTVYSGPAWMGPNAFALPGGQIVLTDALVKLLDDGDGPVDAALLGVVAHEIGHVRGRHGLRRVAEAAAAGTLMAWWVGDYSALLAGGPTVLMQAQYSRAHERDADQQALVLMRAAGIDPRAMVRFFARVKAATPKRDGDDRAFGLASHPADSERIRFFESGGRDRAGGPTLKPGS